MPAHPQRRIDEQPSTGGVETLKRLPGQDRAMEFHIFHFPFSICHLIFDTGHHPKNRPKFIEGLTELTVVDNQCQISNDKWKMESAGHGGGDAAGVLVSMASPELNPLCGCHLSLVVGHWSKTPMTNDDCNRLKTSAS